MARLANRSAVDFASPVSGEHGRCRSGQRSPVASAQSRDGTTEAFVVDVTDVALGAGAAVAGFLAALAAPVIRGLVPVLAGAAGMARRGVPDQAIIAAAHRGSQVRDELGGAAQQLLGRVVQAAVDLVAAAVDLTELVAQHVDLDALAARLDVDAVVARADLDAAVSRVDLGTVVDRLDLDAIVATVDLDAILDRLDLDGIVGRVDLDAVAARLDLDSIVKRVDPDAVVARVDVDAALARLDLAAIARQVIDEIDLPEILRQSTGAVSSEAVRGIRSESVLADEAVARFVDRMLRRRREASS